MSAFKRLSTSDIFVLPYTANKDWIYSITNATTTGSFVTLYEGQKRTGSFLLTETTTSFGKYKRLVFDQINHLYYQSYSGSILNTQSLVNSMNYDSASSQRPTQSYFNFNENPKLIKALPTSSHDTIQVFSIKRDTFGERILPGTLRISSSVSILTDDGAGNLIRFGTEYIGNVFYEQGLVIITHPAYQFQFYPIDISFKNQHTIYEKYIKCTIKEHEMNCSYNPSLKQVITSTTSSIQDFATGSTFVPYATTIGLYNDRNDLLMVAKFSVPMPISSETDQNFLIRIDV